MTTEIKAPAFPESIAEGVIISWNKQEGDFCNTDEVLVEIETDKVVLEVPATNTGILKKITRQVNETVTSQEVIGVFEEKATTETSSTEDTNEYTSQNEISESELNTVSGEKILSPSARKTAENMQIDASHIKGTGRDGRIIKEDILMHAKKIKEKEPEQLEKIHKDTTLNTVTAAPVASDASGRIEKRVPMTGLRKRISQRLLESQENTAMLTTFNEVNMQPVMDIRAKYKEQFEKTHNTRLGFMSFFIKASTEALRRFPLVNASIDGNDIVYHGYQDIGVAVSSDRGLVVPILRDAENMSLAEIESNIRSLSSKAQDGKLSIENLTGGTFTISNGGVFGSMFSTPILNPPQSAILGMHAIKDRPVVIDGEITIRPIMYLALSYDHRLLDGKNAVSFLVAIKEYLEEPTRLLLDI